MVTAGPAHTIEEVAKIVGRSRETLHKYQRDGVDVHDVDAVRAHMAKLRPPVGRGSAGGDSGDLREQKLRAEVAKLNEEVRAKELDNRVREGELVNREAVDRFLSAFVSAERAEMEGWVAEIIVELPVEVRESVSDQLNEKVRMKLLRLSEMPAELWLDEGVQESE
jgi:hypothetical protein